MPAIQINSEYGVLKKILLHEPGPEVENMTPATAERALYSDILNLQIAKKEYAQFKGVLEKVAEVTEVKELLKTIVKQTPATRTELIHKLEKYSGVQGLSEQLELCSDEEFVTAMFEGMPLPQVSLSNFLQQHKYAINPLHNMFFMRDASFCFGNMVFISSMARSVRKPETIILETIHRHILQDSKLLVKLNGLDNECYTIEGGDVLVVSPEVIMLGIGARTTPAAVDTLVNELAHRQALKYVLVQELPHEPESFIHLDMVITLLSENECMVYKPILMNNWQYRTILIEIQHGEIGKISYVENLLKGLKFCGFDYRPIYCGGGDPVLQEREQWHSGANFFAFAPSKIIGYARNAHTTEALIKNGYDAVSAIDVINGVIALQKCKKCLVTIEGSELARGGGGPRCMSMPLVRE
jgi:arginine deiminase